VFAKLGIKKRETKSGYELEVNSKEARVLAKELNYLAEEAEDHGSRMIAVVVPLEDNESSVTSITVTPKEII